MIRKLGQEPAFARGACFVPNATLTGGTLREEQKGISKRFYAACAAMQGMLAHSTRYKPRECDKDLHWHAAIVKESFELADELIKQENQ